MSNRIITKIEVSNAQINNHAASYKELCHYLMYLREGGRTDGYEAIGFENFAKAVLDIKSAADTMSSYLNQQERESQKSQAH